MNKILDNAKATLLICGQFRKEKDFNNLPYTTKEWNSLVERLLSCENLQPKDLLDMNTKAVKEILKFTDEDAKRLVNLLSRRIELAFFMDELDKKAIKIITRGEKNYPIYIRKKLGSLAPPYIYYCGDISLTNMKGIAVVGSRNIDAEGEFFAKLIAEKAAREGFVVFSGGARGTDTAAETSAILSGGKCVSFLAESLLKTAAVQKNMRAIADGNMLLLSLANPHMPFNAGNAIGRNKYIYILSSAAIVVASGYKSGGTWNGALENIKNNWVNLYVWKNSKYAGNMQLIKKGGIALENKGAFSIRELADRPQIGKTTNMESKIVQMELFSHMDTTLS